MKTLIYLFTILTTINGAWYDFIVKFFRARFDLMESNYQNYMIASGAPENMITKPLPPDWIPNADPSKRTPETEAKF